MKLTLKRINFGKNHTAGFLYVDGQYFCDTLEPADRALEWDGVKVMGETAIPIGTYMLSVDYSPKFRRNLPHVQKVKDFEGVRIHSGNTVKDTQGCILVGVRGNDDGSYLKSSTIALMRLLQLLDGKTDVTLKITR